MVNEKYVSQFTDDEVKEEVEIGLQLLDKIQSPIITFLGSHVGKTGDSHYDIAYGTGKELGKKGYAIMTGGGPGVMEAGNRGAKETGAYSIGITAYLIKGEPVNDENLTHRLDMKYMFVRRFILAIRSKALVVFPGGFGTFNEMFDFVTLMQVNMAEKVPVIVVDRKFWEGMFEWVNSLVDKKMIAKSDLSIFKFADSVEEIVTLIEQN